MVNAEGVPVGEPAPRPRSNLQVASLIDQQRREVVTVAVFACLGFSWIAVRGRSHESDMVRSTRMRHEVDARVVDVPAEVHRVRLLRQRLELALIVKPTLLERMMCQE